MQKVHEIIEQLDEAKNQLEFLPTGFKSMDSDLDGGFMRKELIVLGGFTGIGKSYVAGQILFNIARQKFHTAYFSLEISNAMVLSRLIGQQSGVKAIKVMTGNLDTLETDRKITAQTEVYEYEDYMDFYDNVYDYNELERSITRDKPDFVVIDFIQNIIVPGMDEYTRLSTVALRLQRLAKEMNCCILVLSQLSNAAGKNADDGNLEYKGSGSIATVCDLGFVILRDTDLGTIEMILKKNRRGVSGTRWQFSFKDEGGLLV